jgi:hypothetical protein
MNSECYECGGKIQGGDSFIITNVFIDYAGYVINMYHLKCYDKFRTWELSSSESPPPSPVTMKIIETSAIGNNKITYTIKTSTKTNPTDKDWEE